MHVFAKKEMIIINTAWTFLRYYKNNTISIVVSTVIWPIAQTSYFEKYVKDTYAEFKEQWVI